MLQVFVRGEVISSMQSREKTSGDPTGVVLIKCRVYRSGKPEVQDVLIAVNAYIWKRWTNLKDTPKWATFRCSDVMPTCETGKDGVTRAFLWAQGDEFFL